MLWKESAPVCPQSPSRANSGLLVLEDGSAYPGISVGPEGEWVGEVVFNTSMTGYQEIITDPSYWGQMVVFTCPHIGNVGINSADCESEHPWVRAVLARQICAEPSNWRAEQSLPAYLRAHGIPALAEVDTRALTLVLRDKGVMRGALSTTDLDVARLTAVARGAADMSALSPAEYVTRAQTGAWRASVPLMWAAVGPVESPGSSHVVVIDCGIKHKILRCLATLGARVTVAPAATSADEVLALAPDGVLVGNGPGDPAAWPETIATVRGLLGRVPLYGICLGHQIIALACGARTFKLPFGHHGGNHPVRHLASGAVEITAQNHNYAVDAASLRGLPLEVTRLNLYDGTIEGLRHTTLPVECVQYHPEASPGPHDSLNILREFVSSLKRQD
ncbi:MAG: glutamine-hydrolyzing carbamoyl-phosphate synthase small subunit [Chloroflexi bacterium]|nr:glutamine-hydrolyzing carbamoyl-phosphate synthase small subunit [Chloroflexota bacterium]